MCFVLMNDLDERSEVLLICLGLYFVKCVNGFSSPQSFLLFPSASQGWDRSLRSSQRCQFGTIRFAHEKTIDLGL